MINKRTFLTMLAKIGLPIVLQQVISLSLNMIDTFMIGSVGVSELAGLPIKSILFSLLYVLVYTVVPAFLFHNTGVLKM